MADHKARISSQLREAVRLMVEDARTRPEAALAVGLKDDSLYRALRRPEVRALRNDLLRGLREAEASRSIKRVADLADTSKSDAVRLDANELLLDLAGEGPVHRSEGVIHVNHVMPGLTVIQGNWQAHVIEGAARDVTPLPAPRINMLGTPQPHPEAVRRLK